MPHSLQPAVPQGLPPLEELVNPRSAKMNKWDVVTFHPAMIEYTHSWGKGHVFRAMLVSATDPSQYCMAEIKKTKNDMKPLTKAEAKFKEGCAFKMSKVQFNTGASLQYMHTPLKFSVNLNSTEFAALLDDPSMPRQPQSSNTVAESQEISSGQCFDITALITSVGEPGNGGVRDSRERLRVLCTLVDGSRSEASEMRELPLLVFADKAANDDGPQIFMDLRALAGTNRAVTFFAIQGRQAPARGFTFSNTDSFFFVPAVGAKAETLKTAFAEISGADKVAFQSPVRNGLVSNKDYSEVLGTECTIRVLKNMKMKIVTGAAAIDGAEETVWQINFCRIREPQQGTTITTKDGQRIWFQSPTVDHTGQLEIWVSEQAALSLGVCRSHEEFTAALASGNLWFPQPFQSIKVVRKVAQDQVYMHVVEAQQQMMGQALTKASEMLIPLIQTCPEDSSTICMIQKSMHYAMAVTYGSDGTPAGTLTCPCAQVVVLVQSTKKSKLVKMEDG